MKVYACQDLRNIGFVGHSGSGKTTLAEAVLYRTKTIERFGKIAEENTVSDYDPEERKRKISVSTSILPCEYKKVKINIFDTPGYFDFVGETIEALKGIDMAIITLSGKSGVKVGTEKSWQYVNNNNIPRTFFINKLDRENSNFEKTVNQLKDIFGTSVIPIQYPIGAENNFKGVINLISKEVRIFNQTNGNMDIGKIPDELHEKVEEYRRTIMEAVAETDEELLEKYIEEGSLSHNQLYNGVIKALKRGDITPILCGSASKAIGIDTFLDIISEYFPSPKENENTKLDEEGKFSATVFKTVVDPFVGKLSIFKVLAGKAKADSIVYNVNKKKQEKFGSVYFIRGKDQIPSKEISTGDIGAVSKLLYTDTGDTLSQEKESIMYKKIEFPDPVISMSIIPTTKGDEDKISSGLSKLLHEDFTLKVSRDIENADIIISGMGEVHLEVIASKLKNKFGIDVQLETPKVPYRETIKKLVEVQGKHKKQSGGHGQYGDVKIRFEPRKDGIDELLFVDSIVGGAVPRQYIPAVKNGLKESMRHGILGGFPVIGLKATLFDGSYHPVDSSEMAFKIAASIAYKKGLEAGNSALLEPIMEVKIQVPNEYMGEIISDVNKKRGKILGIESYKHIQTIITEMPMAEMFKYATNLRAITGGRGAFNMKFKRYEEVTMNDVPKIINKIKK